MRLPVHGAPLSSSAVQLAARDTDCYIFHGCTNAAGKIVQEHSTAAQKDQMAFLVTEEAITITSCISYPMFEVLLGARSHVDTP